MRTRVTAFSLIELLVVVAIVSLLLAILLPAMTRARDQAKLVYCHNNLRSIWSGILTYSLENRERVPMMENVNDPSAVPGTGPDADPFDPAFPTTYGNVLQRYVNQKSWVCPSAVTGYPFNNGNGGWTMTYRLSETNMGIGELIPWNQSGGNRAGGSNAEVTNYWPFDGRPLKLIDGRRYVRFGKNENRRGKWNIRFPVVSDMVLNETEPIPGGFRYPHRGVLDVRNDLENYRDDFGVLTNSTRGGVTTGRNELHADDDRVSVFLTRNAVQHQPGY